MRARPDLFGPVASDATVSRLVTTLAGDVEAALAAIHQVTFDDVAAHTGVPTDQAWIESFNGHLKAEYPHLLAIEDPATLRAELAVTREFWNAVRLHAGIGYVTPNDEHEGRGEAIRKVRQAGLEQARKRRLAWHRQQRHTEPIQGPDDVDLSNANLYHEVRNTSVARGQVPRSPPGSRSVRRSRRCAHQPHRDWPAHR